MQALATPDCYEAGANPPSFWIVSSQCCRAGSLKGSLCYLGTENKTKSSPWEAGCCDMASQGPRTSTWHIKNKTQNKQINKLTKLNTSIVEFPRKIIITSWEIQLIVRQIWPDLKIWSDLNWKTWPLHLPAGRNEALILPQNTVKMSGDSYLRRYTLIDVLSIR